MDDHGSFSVESIRQLRDRGQYRDAVARLEHLIRHAPHDLELTVEFGETLFIQGYFARAFSVLNQDHIARSDSHDGLIVIAQILRCYAYLHMTTRFEESGQTANEVYASFLSRGPSEVVNDITARVESYYGQFKHVMEICGASNDGSFREQLLSRLAKGFPILIGQASFREAFLVARTYAFCSTKPSKNKFMRAITEDDELPGLYRAQAQLFLARDFSDPKQPGEQEFLTASAKRLFQLEEHAHGALDADFVRLCSLPPGTDQESLYKATQTLCRQYEPLGFPGGLAFHLFQIAKIAMGSRHFTAESQYLAKLESLHAASGSKLAWTMCRIVVLANLGSRLTNHAKVIEAGDALWNDLAQSDCSSFRGQAAELVSQAYLQLKDRKNMQHWSERAGYDLGARNLVALPDFLTGFDLGAMQGVNLCFLALRSATDPDSLEYSAEVAASKYETLVRHALSSRYNKSEAWDILDSVIQTWEEHISRLENKNKAAGRLAQVRIQQASVLTFRSTVQADSLLEEAALDLLKEARTLYSLAKESGMNQLASVLLQREGIAYISIAQKRDCDGDDEARLAWQTAQAHHETALTSARECGLTTYEAENAVWIAVCQYRQWKHGWYSSEIVLESLLEAEVLLDRQRQEISILRGISAITAKRDLGLKRVTQCIYGHAITVCVTKENVLDAWQWLQKSKARSLSDAIGLGILIPSYLMERINGSPVALRLFETETALAAVLSSSSGTGRFRVREQLESHQNKMRQEPPLSELLALRAGSPIVPKDLSTLTSQIGFTDKSAIVFIDWVTQDNDISVFVMRKGELPLISQIPLTVQFVREWVSEHVHKTMVPSGAEIGDLAFSGIREEDDATEGPLRDLDALVAPLFALTQPNDLLVFSPTNILHALPLHALRFGVPGEETILIERNPVVYCASLTTFVQCCRQAEAMHLKDSKKVFAAIYEQDNSQDSGRPSSSIGDERSRVYEHNESISQDMCGEAFCGARVTQACIQDALKNANWVHFFGHNDYSQQSVAEQGLIVSDEHRKEVGVSAGQVTVQDLFESRIRATHITLLACASAVQDFAVGDEPLGLITAFLSAGASSVLGTLWPVSSRAARYYSERFYHHLKHSAIPSSNESKVYNLAAAVREAALDVRKSWHFRQPYHWASFVLHGAWFYNGAI